MKYTNVWQCSVVPSAFIPTPSSQDEIALDKVLDRVGTAKEKRTLIQVVLMP